MLDLRVQLQETNFVQQSQISAMRMKIKNRLGQLTRKGNQDCQEFKDLVQWRERLNEKEKEIMTTQLAAASAVDSSAAARLREIATELDENAAATSAIIATAVSHLYG